MNVEEYVARDATALAALVRCGQVTPSELLEAALARMDAVNPAINAVVHRRDEQARRDAVAPTGGPFSGVPFLLKDLMAAVAGEPLTSGSRLLATFAPQRDSNLVTRLRAAGLVFAGKTNTPEFGIMGVTEPRLFGPCRNPWDLGRTPGGSSGGSAAAVAAGIVPMAHGGDGGGSLRIPASCCGLFGLKPSRGRNPLGPVFGESWSGLVQEHAITRSVRDSAALLDATRGADPGAPYVAPEPERPYLEEVECEQGRLRIAWTAASLFGERTHPDCVAAVEDAARLAASLGHEVTEARPRFDKREKRRAYLAIVAVNTARAVDVSAQLAGRRPRAGDLEPETRLLATIGRHMRAVDYQAAIDGMQTLRVATAAFFEQHDLLLTPTLAQPPLPIGALDLSAAERAIIRALRAAPSRRLLEMALDQLAGEAFEATANTMLFNETGQPAMSVPLYWNSDGLPIGVQFVAPYGEEGLLFRFAAQLERARPWFDRRPRLD